MMDNHYNYKKNLTRLSSMCFLLLGLFLIFGSVNVFAKAGDLLADFPETVKFFLNDKTTGLIYATTYNDVLIIDPKTKTMKKIESWGGLTGLAMSRDSSRLYVAKSDAQEIMVIDTTTNEILESIELPYMPYDLVYAPNGYLYATLNRGNQEGVMKIDTRQNEFIGLYLNVWIFPYQHTVFSESFVKISPDGKMLYFADKGMSPGTLSKYSIAEDNSVDTTPEYIYSNKHGALGSNGQDLHLTLAGDYIYYVVGSGNSLYDIARIRTKDMAIKGRLNIGAYPNAITTSPDGKIAYTNNSAFYVEVWDTERQVKLCQFDISGRSPYTPGIKLTTDSKGEYLLVSYLDHLLIYEAGCPN